MPPPYVRSTPKLASHSSAFEFWGQSSWTGTARGTALDSAVMEVDLVNRDPNGLNEHCRASFEDILGEPDAPHSLDCVWRNSFKCYSCALSCWYQFLTTVFGLCTALFWGFVFAYIAFDAVWVTTPSLKVYQISCGYCQKYYGICMNCIVAPCCEAFGLFFSRIHVQNN